jgi:hypothetical protein
MSCGIPCEFFNGIFRNSSWIPEECGQRSATQTCPLNFRRHHAVGKSQLTRFRINDITRWHTRPTMIPISLSPPLSPSSIVFKPPSTTYPLHLSHFTCFPRYSCTNTITWVWGQARVLYRRHIMNVSRWFLSQLGGAPSADLRFTRKNHTYQHDFIQENAEWSNPPLLNHNSVACCRCTT